MRSHYCFILVLFLLFSQTLNLSAASEPEIVPGRMIVKFKPVVKSVFASPAADAVFSHCQATEVEKVFPHYKYQNSPRRNSVDLSRIFQLTVPTNIDIRSLCQELEQKFPHIEYAEPVYVCKPDVVPNDPDYNLQYYLPQIKAEQAWEIAEGDSNVIIAIVDTGVDWDHPDLAAIIWRNPDESLNGSDDDNNGFVDDVRGWDFVTGVSQEAAAGEDGETPDNDPMDFNGHGTHCSGLAAAATNNEIGVASISWGCRIMPLRIGYHNKEDDGRGNSDWMAKAFIYAADNGASVINLSFTNGGSVIKDAARYAHENGVLVVTSAGNDDTSEMTDALDELPFTLKVAAVDRDDHKAWYSNFGDWVQVSAPGGNHEPGLYNTYFNDIYTNLSGTSMASPFTAGLIGLVKSFHPDWSNSQLMFQVVETADNIDDLNPEYAGQLGHGRINAERALTETVHPLPKILMTYAINDSIAGNGNGVIDAGEKCALIIAVENVWAPAHNLTATLTTNDYATTVKNETFNFGAVSGIADITQPVPLTNESQPFEIDIHPNALPHQIKASLEFTADGGYQKVFDIVLPISPPIFYVDDDTATNGSACDVAPFYCTDLEALGYSYEHWQHLEQGRPTAIKSTQTVIWNCTEIFPSLDNNDRASLMQHLDDGGGLFLSGQDIGWDQCSPESPNRSSYSVKFFSDYLHARFEKDDAGQSKLIGIPNDPISTGLSIEIDQPCLRNIPPQPDEISPLGEANSIFNYPDGNSGAIRYDGDYRLVYFAFGGLEAITSPQQRRLILARTLNWINGLSVSHRPLRDTENTSENYEVKIIARSTRVPIQTVALFWDTDSQLPFDNKITMQAIDDSTYQAFIPAQESGEIRYTVFVQNYDGFYAPYKYHTFRIGTDQIAPTITVPKPIPGTLDKFGPYLCQMKITDNLGVDTSNVWLYYGIKDALVDSIKMTGLGNDIFQAHIPGIATYGDTVVYYARAGDLAAKSNCSFGQKEQFTIGLEDFEDETLTAWEISGDGWAVDSSFAYSGHYAVTESPGRNLGPGENHVLQLKKPLDLSDSDNAMLVFWQIYSFHPNKAFGLVEVSIDSGDTWQELYKTTNVRRDWGIAEISLANYVGHDAVFLRFRSESAATANDRFDGWYLDAIQLRAGLPVGLPATVQSISIPDKFLLLQNYPNPFNPTTKINYGLPQSTRVTLKVFNLLGQQVRTLVDQKQSAGMHQVMWDGKNDDGKRLTSGIYFYQLKSATFIQTRKMIWIN